MITFNRRGAYNPMVQPQYLPPSQNTGRLSTYMPNTYYPPSYLPSYLPGYLPYYPPTGYLPTYPYQSYYPGYVPWYLHHHAHQQMFGGNLPLHQQHMQAASSIDDTLCIVAYILEGERVGRGYYIPPIFINGEQNNEQMKY